MPWNQSTFLGYIAEQNLMCFFGGTYMVGDGVVLLLFVSICMHHQAFYEMFEFSINEWNQLDANPNDDQFILDQIRFHISVKK